MMRSSTGIFNQNKAGDFGLGKLCRVRFADPRNKQIVDKTLRFFKADEVFSACEYAGMVIKVESKLVVDKEPKVALFNVSLLWNGQYRDVRVKGVIRAGNVVDERTNGENDPLTIACYGNAITHRLFRIMTFMDPREGKRVCEIAPFFKKKLIIPGILKNGNKGYASMLNGIRFYLPDPITNVERFECLASFFSEGKMVREWVEFFALECDYVPGKVVINQGSQSRTRH